MQFLVIKDNQKISSEEKLIIKDKFNANTSIICDHIDYEWSSDDNTIYFIGRNPNIEIYSKYNIFNVDENNNLNFINGWIKKNEEDKLLDSNNLKNKINNDDFDGFFNVGKIKSEGESEIFSSLVSPSIYYTLEKDGFGLSNRISVLSDVFDKKKLNKKHIASQIQYTTYSLTNDTIYSDIFQIPFGTKIHFNEKLIFSRIFDLFHCEKLKNFYNENKNKYWDDCFKLMKSQVKAFKNLNLSEIRVGISGGKDSRLLFGLYNDILKSTFTWGPVYSPEVIIGKIVSNLLEMDHENIYTQTEKDNLLKKMPNHLFCREFEMCPWDFGILNDNTSNMVFVNGQEFIKGLPYEHEKSNEDILKEVNQYFSNNYSIDNSLNKDILKENLNNSKELLDNLHDTRLFPPIKRILSRGRWVAKVNETINETSFPLFPFLTNTANKFGYNIPIQNILNQEFHYEIIKRINPDLLKIPLFDDQFKQTKIPPIENKIPGKLNYKNTYLMLYFDYLKDFILENYDSVSDIVKKDFIINLSKEKLFNNGKLSMIVYDILQAIILIKTPSFKDLKSELNTDFVLNLETKPEDYDENCIKAYMEYNKDIIKLKQKNNEMEKERNKLSNKIHESDTQNKKLKQKNNEMKRYITTAGFVKYKTKNIVDRLKKTLKS